MMRRDEKRNSDKLMSCEWHSPKFTKTLIRCLCSSRNSFLILLIHFNRPVFVSVCTVYAMRAALFAKNDHQSTESRNRFLRLQIKLQLFHACNRLMVIRCNSAKHFRHFSCISSVDINCRMRIFQETMIYFQFYFILLRFFIYFYFERDIHKERMKVKRETREHKRN